MGLNHLLKVTQKAVAEPKVTEACLTPKAILFLTQESGYKTSATDAGWGPGTLTTSYDMESPGRHPLAPIN